jgi:hypothetical protein
MGWGGWMGLPFASFNWTGFYYFYWLLLFLISFLASFPYFAFGYYFTG